MYTRAKVAGCIIPCDLSSRAEQPSYQPSYQLSWRQHSYRRVEQRSYKRSSGQAAISRLRGEHSAPHDSWRLAKWLSCQLLASYLSKQVSDMVKQLYPISYPISCPMAVGSQEADLQWCGPRCGPRCGSLRFNLISIICTTRVQTTEKTATRARRAKGRTTSGHDAISSTSRCNDKYAH